MGYTKDNFTATDDGELLCFSQDHSTVTDPWTAIKWCEHIEHLIACHQDGELISWPDQEQIERDLEIPMFPTKDLWCSVRLYPIPQNRMWEVWWKHPEKEDYEFVLFLHSYEGRQVIRMSLLNLMIADDSRPPECMASSHGFAAQQEWVASKQLGSGHMVQQWCVYYYGQCMYCLRNSDVSDLIPEKEGSPWS